MEFFCSSPRYAAVLCRFILPALVFALPAKAIPLIPDLGIAGTFNAFVLEDMDGYHSDVEGRLAVGGDLKLENYSIGLQLPNSRGLRDDLIVGGNADFQYGRVYSGNAVVGNDNIKESVGFYPGDDPGEASGSVNSVSIDPPLDFDSIGADLRAKSTLWGGWTANGETTLSNSHELFFTGEGKLSVFNVYDTQLNTANTIWFDMPRYTTAVINVLGETINMSNLGFHHTALPGTVRKMPDNQPGKVRHDGSLTNRILFNFVDAKNITLHGIGFKGSLLAPLADVLFYNGHIDGNFVSKSLNAPDLSGLSLDDARTHGRTSGQFNNYRFNQVPAPSTLASLVIGLLLLFLCGRRRTPNAMSRVPTPA